MDEIPLVEVKTSANSGIVSPVISRQGRLNVDKSPPSRLISGARLAIRPLGISKGARVKPYADLTDQRVIKALAHPMRVQVLNVLEQRAASPSEIADELDLPLGNVSYHVRQLAASGLIQLVRETPRRGSVEHHYELTARPDIGDREWAQLPDIVKHAMVSAALGPIGRLVNEAAATGGFTRTEAHLSRTALTLDGQGWKDASAELVGVFERLAKIERESQERLEAADHQDESHSTVVLMHFESPPVAAEPAVPRAERRDAADRAQTS
jgi:DNA-binding transcriptional ArsR family regulator